MKVVIFCGGLGMRLREAGDDIPKPMVTIGHRPILWHLMKYYAHFGHTDFILCLGYRGDVIKKYFLNYEETSSNDFVLSGGGREIELMNRDISDWRITFADTGVNANIGQRLVAVRKYLAGEDVFLANYADGLTDMHLPSVIERFESRGKIGNFVSIRPNLSFHAVSGLPDGGVREIKPVRETDLRINTGFFMFRREIFDYIRAGEELVEEPFQRLIASDQLLAYPYDGFTASMDTFKDKQHFDELYAKGKAPWEVWQQKDVTANKPIPSLSPNAMIAQPSAISRNKPAVKYLGGDSMTLLNSRAPETPIGSAGS
ncbi:MAG: glucose-phosphate cytidylyltransferase [Gemmatimonadaceae bacterium]|jgi:glucose-1-phosphate cytidylyltransferase|nr:glucose-phosphate cytidylyltransferase [Gemmatimonadaceae bacterium]